MKESRASNKKLLTELESENQTHSERADAANKLCEGWVKENKLLLLQGLPQLTLKKYKESVNYQTDDCLVFLAGAEELWLAFPRFSRQLILSTTNQGSSYEANQIHS
jgi:hypothetical protein